MVDLQMFRWLAVGSIPTISIVHIDDDIDDEPTATNRHREHHLMWNREAMRVANACLPLRRRHDL